MPGFDRSVRIDGLDYVQLARLDASEDFSLCWHHHLGEYARGAWLVCGECGHVYLRPGDLSREWRRALRRMEGWRFMLHPARYFRRARRIGFCQHCVHDF